MIAPGDLLDGGMTVKAVDAAAEGWGFNCGPGALCGALGVSPRWLRPHLLDFETKGYTNPTLMLDILRGLGVVCRQIYRADAPHPEGLPPEFTWPPGGRGLMRVQWSGWWTRPGVPMAARYRHTHWVAWEMRDQLWICDVNAVEEWAPHEQGWLSWPQWRAELVPWIIHHCVPGGDGREWPTHILEIPSEGGRPLDISGADWLGPHKRAWDTNLPRNGGEA